MIYIGAENIVSPLASTAGDNFDKIRQGFSAIAKTSASNFSHPVGIISNADMIEGMTRLESLIIQSISSSTTQYHDVWSEGRSLMILSTTKGDIDRLGADDIAKARPTYLLERVKSKLGFSSDLMIISNACISGLLACIHAHDLIRQGSYDHVMVIGADLVTEFTYKGFESFFALSDAPCKPFDSHRDGLSLGEAVSTVVLSNNRDFFQNDPQLFLGGASANDANHISGPSREGEGLYRAINLAFDQAGVNAEDIDYISAHGTATRYNDDMESVAFHRAGLEQIPVNSFKGYFGHTLGAAGVLELALSMQSMNNNLVIKSLGCDEPGTAKPLNIIENNTSMPLSIILKTASGFGGCNAAAILRKP